MRMLKLCQILTISSLILFIPLALTASLLASPAQDYAPRARIAPASDACPSLPPPTGNIVSVSSVSELQNAVNSASSGDTILISDGTYNMNGVSLWFTVPHVALRSASGNREAVILDGNYETCEIVVVAASNVTIADLTLREASCHPIHVVSTGSSDTLNTLIYDVHIVDPSEQAIKINPYTAEGAMYFPDDGVIACSHIELTDAGRPHVDPAVNGCYTGGVDAHQARGWTIRDNVIEGFWCGGDSDPSTDHLSEHAIHLWRASRDTLVERNVLRDNARGIGFGLMTSGNVRTYPDDPCPGTSGYVDHYGGVIRNNFVFAGRSELFASEAGFDCGICLWNACGARVLHNTVFTTDPAHSFSSIEWRFTNADPDIINNLVNDTMRERDGASATQSGNATNAQSAWFVDAASGDLHLVSTATDAIDQVTAPADVSDDIDGDLRPIGSASDVGADEHGMPPPAAVTDLRVTHAVTGLSTLTATLRWTAPTDAVTYTLRHSDTHISDVNWDDAVAITVPFTASAPGSAEVLTAAISYAGGTTYFALRSQNPEGNWSVLSNNAFWPRWGIHLPLVLRNE